MRAGRRSVGRSDVVLRCSFSRSECLERLNARPFTTTKTVPPYLFTRGDRPVSVVNTW